jgi:hypothetical protein
MPDWRAFAEEMGHWRARGRAATFWWRDDDAGAATPELARLVDLARALEVPLCVAAVPAWLDEGGTELLAVQARVTVVQHGWNHANHARSGAKKIELGGGRSMVGIEADLRRGLALCAERLGPRWFPALVPPWNRMDPRVLARLAHLGYGGVSRFGPRVAKAPLPEVNTHVDIVAWHTGRGFVGENLALSAAVAHLRSRREALADPDEPTGLLTHHAVHDEACWRFTRRLIEEARSLGGTFLTLPGVLRASTA